MTEERKWRGYVRGNVMLDNDELTTRICEVGRDRQGDVRVETTFTRLRLVVGPSHSAELEGFLEIFLKTLTRFS